MRNKILSIVFLVSVCCNLAFAQNTSSIGVQSKKVIDSLIQAESYQKAEALLTMNIKYYAKTSTDSLPNYVRLVGNYELAHKDWNVAVKKAEKFVADIKKTLKPVDQIKALIELSNLYFDARFHQKNYDTSHEALQIANSLIDFDPSTISLLEYNKGNALLYMGKNQQAKVHFKKTKSILEENPNIEKDQFFNTYNNLGRTYANTSQVDSSNYYYNKALHVLDDFKNSFPDRYYKKALVQNNLSLNHQNIGNAERAIEILQNAAKNYKTYIETGKDQSKKTRAKRNRLIAIDNLGSFFYDIGQYAKAIELIKLSYEQKKSFLPEDDPDLAISKIILAEIYFAAKDFQKANHFITDAVAHIDRNPDRMAYVDSYAKNLKASISDAMGDYEEATLFYEKSESILNNDTSREYLRNELDGFIRMSKFYLKSSQNQKALKLAKIGYDYTNQQSFQNLLVKINHVKNLADIHLQLENYKKALTYCEEGLTYYNNLEFKTNNISDAIRITFEKPDMLLIKARAKYELQNDKSSDFIKMLLSELNEGIEILDRRRSAIKTVDDLNILLVENQEFFDFIKLLYLELYQLTGHNEYLKKLLEINESLVYNKIRARLSLVKNVHFKNVPKQILERENLLKEELLNPIKQNTDVSTYISSNKVWMAFLDRLKTDYPNYYNLKYGKITETLDDIKTKIPSETTLVRYLHIDNEDGLYVYVTDGEFEELYPLAAHGIDEKIKVLNNYNTKIEGISEALHECYKKLWAPFASKIRTKNVIIFPDAQLFNLSFELLLSKKIKTFDELATESLLQKYNISYNYSLYLVNQDQKASVFKSDFSGFAPEFSSDMKKDYALAITDSIHLDQTYLTLLPQPFSSNLVDRFSKRFDGDSFLNENASKQLFVAKAKEHKIIHIGTHAESNNVNPELSRLVFSKNVSDSTNINDNYLYTYEIYNENLSSNLAILTACETGKPTYQPGEGMISLAHAFNYAGSESILTSLWQIDEQSSTQILEYFYTYLEEGLSKDEALRLAKLDYLSQAKGRTLHPQYWAGLVLMGDTSPIELSNTNSWLWCILATVALILIIFFIVVTKRKTSVTSEGLSS